MRLIDADALAKAILDGRTIVKDADNTHYMGLHMGDVLRVIETQPTVKAEQKKGEWQEHYVEGTDLWDRRRFYCSACGDWQTYGMPAYCPSCGAYMRGGNDE